MNCAEISVFDLLSEKKYEAGSNEWGYLRKLFHLKIYSPKAGYFIQAAFNWKKYYNYYMNTGGVLLVSGIDVVFTNTNEVCLYATNAGKINRYIRAAKSNNEVFAMLKCKLANLLKEFWVAEQKNTDKNYVSITYNKSKQPFNYSFEEFRCLYEFLKGRDIKKIKRKYGADVYKEIIGQEIEDMFILSSIETIKNEITELQCNADAETKRIKHFYDEQIANLYNKSTTECNTVKTDTENKIKELELQINEMMKMMYA